MIEDYERFARSFAKVKAADIRGRLDELYAGRRFWPEPLLQISPRFKPGGSVAELVQGGVLSPECADIFAVPDLADGTLGRCPISGIDDSRLLRASHMKPWADCETDAERLDVHNGLLLAAHLDAAFDAGLISFAPDGTLMVATMLSVANTERLGLCRPFHLPLSPAHAPFLAWHRQEVFKG